MKSLCGAILAITLTFGTAHAQSQQPDIRGGGAYMPPSQRAMPMPPRPMAADPENCGTPDEPKACTKPIPKTPLKKFPKDRKPEG